MPAPKTSLGLSGISRWIILFLVVFAEIQSMQNNFVQHLQCVYLYLCNKKTCMLEALIFPLFVVFGYYYGLAFHYDSIFSLPYHLLMSSKVSYPVEFHIYFAVSFWLCSPSTAEDCHPVVLLWMNLALSWIWYIS